MAKKTITTEEVVEGDDAKPADDALDTDVLRALTDIEGTDDIRWQIHRLSEPNAGYCGEVSTVELSTDAIARAFGPGRYRVKGIRPNGTYYKSAVVKIAQPFKVNDADAAAETAKLLENARSGDMMPLLLAMMNSNTSIVTAALNGNRQQSNSFPWQALLVASPGLLTAVREFFVRPDPDDKSLEKVLKQLTVLEKLRGDDKSGSNWTDVVRDALSSLPALVTRGGQPANPVPVPATRVAPSALSPPAQIRELDVSGDEPAIPATPEAIEPTPENGAMIWLQQQLTNAVEWARLNRDPQLRAEVLIEEFPPFLPVSMILGMLKRDDWFEQLCNFQSACAPYRGWFEELRNELITQLEQPNDDDAGRNDDSRSGE